MHEFKENTENVQMITRGYSDWVILKIALTLTHQQTTFENIVAKGEIAHDEQFLLWPQCFQL